ncbi:MAG: alpha/beta hydrolase [Sandaracinaceae bacterium]
MATPLIVRGREVELVRHPGEGPPLLLVHGAGSNARAWDPVARALGGFEVACPSLPGRGDGARAPESAAEAGAWLAEVIDALGGPPPFVLGHSYGGAVALELALTGAPLAGLVLVATGARLRVHPAVLAAAAAAVEGGSLVSTRFAFVGAERAIVDAYEAACATTPPDATQRDWIACDSFDRIGALSGVHVPALVVGGTADALTPPKYHRYLAEHLPRAQLVMVEGRGHMLPWEDPQGFARMVRSFGAAC